MPEPWWFWERPGPECLLLARCGAGSPLFYRLRSEGSCGYTSLLCRLRIWTRSEYLEYRIPEGEGAETVRMISVGWAVDWGPKSDAKSLASQFHPAESSGPWRLWGGTPHCMKDPYWYQNFLSTSASSAGPFKTVVCFLESMSFFKFLLSQILAFSVHWSWIKNTETEFGGNRKVAFNSKPVER